VRFYTEIGRFVFLRPPVGDLGATYNDHLRLIGKRVVNFLLALIDHSRSPILVPIESSIRLPISKYY